MEKPLRSNWANELHQLADEIFYLHYQEDKPIMPTNLEVYQLLKRQEAALEQLHADLQGYIACRPMSDSIATALKLQCSGILLRLDDLRAMLKRFEWPYRTLQNIDYVAAGTILYPEENGRVYKAKPNHSSPFSFRPQCNAEFIMQHPELFEVVIVEEN